MNPKKMDILALETIQKMDLEIEGQIREKFYLHILFLVI